jgi:protein-tyrosine phosphatase
VQSLARHHLVLTATRQQRAHCVTLAPAMLRRTFTLRQFARLAGVVDPGCLGNVPAARRARNLLGLVDTIRGGLQPVGVDDDDIADPARRPLAGFRDCAGEIHTAVDKVIDAIMRT